MPEEVSKTNDCPSCEHMQTEHEGLHCYMFKTEPEPICMQHSRFKEARRKMGPRFHLLCSLKVLFDQDDSPKPTTTPEK